MAPKISFYAFAIYVIDMEESVLYYKRLGYREDGVDDTENYRYNVMQLPGGSGTRIEIREPFVTGEEGKTATVFTLDFDEWLDTTQAYFAQRAIIEDLMFRGFTFLNMTPKEFYSCPLGDIIKMVDPQGARIEFVCRA